MNRTVLALLISLTLAPGCSLQPFTGDRMFTAERFEEAEAAYRAYVGKHQSTAQGQKALYRLALIYLLPDSPLNDRELGRRTLNLVRLHPQEGVYSRQASLLLEMYDEIETIEKAADLQASLARHLESELGRLELQAAQASSEAGEHEVRARRLNGEINLLRSQIEQLSTALRQREQELLRIKEIDLGRAP